MGSATFALKNNPHRTVTSLLMERQCSFLYISQEKKVFTHWLNGSKSMLSKLFPRNRFGVFI